MPLFLFEVPTGGDEAAINRAVSAVSAAAAARKATLIEAQATADRRRLYLIVEAADRAVADAVISAGGLAPVLTKEVRLIGQDLATIKAKRAKANFLVEWNLPSGLTMEAYLKRKAEKTPLYEKVPEVSFERTYVCEDLSKCLCLYDGPDEAAIRRARSVVGAPIDQLNQIRSAGTQ
jgi:hypothetical protein